MFFFFYRHQVVENLCDSVLVDISFDREQDFF